MSSQDISSSSLSLDLVDRSFNGNISFSKGINTVTEKSCSFALQIKDEKAEQLSKIIADLQVCKSNDNCSVSDAYKLDFHFSIQNPNSSQIQKIEAVTGIYNGCKISTETSYLCAGEAALIAWIKAQISNPSDPQCPDQFMTFIDGKP